MVSSGVRVSLDDTRDGRVVPQLAEPIIGRSSRSRRPARFEEHRALEGFMGDADRAGTLQDHQDRREYILAKKRG